MTYIFLCGVGLVTEIYLPLKLGNVIDATIDKNYKGVIMMLVQAFLLFLLSLFVNYFKNMSSTQISIKMSEQIKNKIIAESMILPMKKVDLLKNGQIMSKLGDADIITGFFMSILNNLFINLISVFFTAIILYKISFMLALVYYINIPILFLVIRYFGKIIKQKEKLIADSRDNMNSFVFGMLQGIREIRALGGVNNVLNEFFAIHKEYVDKLYYKGKVTISLGSFNTLISGITQIIFLLIACTEIIQGRLSLGMYYAFNAYANRFSSLLTILTNMSSEAQTVFVSSERIIPYYINTLDENVDERKVLVKSVNDIKIDCLRFGYNQDMLVLKGLKFDFHRNSLYVIVGSNGCGKSTLLDLIMNFYEPTDGEIFINNINVNEIKKECLFSQIAYIRQNPFFFNRSIVENMSMIDKGISIEKIKKVCDMVGMNEYIEQLPNGYDTIMGESGSRFSGGQIHRLALARSLIRNANAYIIDELTADLDGENEKIIMNILAQLVRSGKLVIMVSHRLSTIVKANEIIVMDNGNIVASGTHEVLIKECDVYQKLYGSEWESYCNLIHYTSDDDIN